MLSISEKQSERYNAIMCRKNVFDEPEQSSSFIGPKKKDIRLTHFHRQMISKKATETIQLTTLKTHNTLLIRYEIILFQLALPGCLSTGFTLAPLHMMS